MTKYENLDFNGLEEALRNPSSGYRVSYYNELFTRPSAGKIEYVTSPFSHPLLNEQTLKDYAATAFKQEGLTGVVCIHAKNILAMMGRKDPLIIFVAIYEDGKSFDCHQMRLTELYNLLAV